MSNPITPTTPAPAKWSWKTTLSGVVAALGAFVALIIPWLQGSPDPRLQAVGGVLVALGLSTLGGTSRDNNKSDQDVGVRPPATVITPTKPPGA